MIEATQTLPRAAAVPPIGRDVVIDALRCWRHARDNGLAVLPSLAQALSARDCAMIGPVLASLLQFYEGALGRPIMLDAHDEAMLLSLLDGSRPCTCIDCPEPAGRALDCALCSTRIMLALVLAPVAGHS